MQMLAFSYPTLAVSTIYCIWSAYRRAQLQRQGVLHERVAYMLWVMANPIPCCAGCDATAERCEPSASQACV